MDDLWTLFGCSTMESRIHYEGNVPFKDSCLDKVTGINYRYYTKGLVRALAKAIGKVVKVDYNTMDGNRGKFARVVVIIDISKPLVPFLGIDGKQQVVVYKGLPTICYICGKVGHIKKSCKQKSNVERTESSPTAMEETRVPRSVDEQADNGTNLKDYDLFGPWMQVARRRNHNQMVKGKPRGSPMNQRKQILIDQRFTGLSEKEGGDNLQCQADILPKTMQNSNGQIKGINGKPMQSMAMPNGKPTDCHLTSSFKLVSKSMHAPAKAKENITKGRSQTYLGKRQTQEVGPHVNSLVPNFNSFFPLSQVNPNEPKFGPSDVNPRRVEVGSSE